jgi:hypothetical protein
MQIKKAGYRLALTWILFGIALLIAWFEKLIMKSVKSVA